MSEPYFTSALIIIEVIFSLMVLNTLKKAKASSTLLISLGIVFAIWLTSVYTMLSSGFFSATGVPQFAFTAAIFIPVILGLLAFKFSKSLSTVIKNMPTSSYLALQQMRAPFGVMFFFTASLPVWFQYIGGLGDIAAGMGALFAIGFLQKHPGKERQAIIRGNVIGILDFAVVMFLGVGIVLKMQSPDMMFDLIPLYVVPIFILLHIFSLMKLHSLQKSQAQQNESKSNDTQLSVSDIS